MTVDVLESTSQKMRATSSRGETMPATLPLKKMTIEEKIQAMEAIWDDLCDQANSPVAPDWHSVVLTEREIAIERGEDEFIDWETAKRKIKKEL